MALYRRVPHRHIVGGEAEADALLAQAAEAGATLTDQPHERP